MTCSCLPTAQPRLRERNARLAPSYVVSVKSHEGEYMLALVCDDHKSVFEPRLAAMQEANKIPRGTIHFQPVKAVVTNCVTGINEDYIDLKLKDKSSIRILARSLFCAVIISFIVVFMMIIFFFFFYYYSSAPKETTFQLF